MPAMAALFCGGSVDPARRSLQAFALRDGLRKDGGVAEAAPSEAVAWNPAGVWAA